MGPPNPKDSDDALNEDIIPGAQDIYSQAQECKTLFLKYLKTTKAYSQQVSECQHRFLTWVSFLGVFANESASLDCRLQGAPEVKGLVLSMLRVLKRNLERGK